MVRSAACSMTSAHLKCTLCEHSFVGFVDSSLNTPVYGGVKVPELEILGEKGTLNMLCTNACLQSRMERRKFMCVFLFAIFCISMTNFHNEMIEHFTIHEKMQDVDVKKLDDIFVAKEHHEYFKANVEKKNLMVSIDRMLRWNAIDKNPNMYYDKLAEEDKRENADDEVQSRKKKCSLWS